MERRIKYFDRFILVIIPMIFAAFLAYKMAFAMMNVVNASLAQNWEQFWVESLWLGLFSLLILPVNILTAYCQSKFTKRVITRMKTHYIQAVFGKDINEFQKDNNSTYISALTNDFSIIETDYLEQIIAITEGFISFATAIIIFSLINPFILLIGVGIVIMNGLLSNIIKRPISKHNQERSHLFAGYNSFVKEVLSAFNIIKNNGLEEKVLRNYHTKSESVQQKKYVIDRLMSYVFVAQNALSTATILGMLLVMVKLAMAGVITLAGVIVIINNLDRLMRPISVVSEAIPKIRSVKAIFKRIDESLQSKSCHKESLNFNQLTNGIEFKNVSFAYDDNLVLNKINLTFEKGKKYLVIGPSGGGKSTILRLLRKYFMPSEGMIEIDGLPLEDVFKQDYFSRIANIEQTIFLFEDTLRNNLTLFKDYSEQEIADAVEKAGLLDFVRSNPEGLEYMIYDNGKNVSGGEKSRIAIARGLLNQADIIMLDEAFASLDYKRAKEIEATLMDLNEVTIINVSHVVIEENKSRYDGIIMVKNKSAEWTV